MSQGSTDKDTETYKGTDTVTEKDTDTVTVTNKVTVTDTAGSQLLSKTFEFLFYFTLIGGFLF